MELCREHHVVKFERLPSGAFSILFGPPPSPDAKKNGASDPFHVKRAHYANLLGRSVSDEELKLLPDGG